MKYKILLFTFLIVVCGDNHVVQRCTNAELDSILNHHVC